MEMKYVLQKVPFPARLATFAGFGAVGLALQVLVLAPLLAGSLFNYWYWPLVGARTLHEGFLHFLWASPRTTAVRQAPAA